MDFCTLHQQLQILNEEDYNKLSENAISWINSFETEELKTFSIGLLNACMSTHYTANKIRIGPGFVISMQLVYELMRILPIFDPLFDSMLMSQTSSEAVNAIGLVITGFLEYILSPSWSAEEVARNINILKTVSLLTWKEAFTYQTQKQLANIISQALILQFQSSQNFLFFTHSVVGFETIIVTILRLTTLLLQNFIEPQSGLSECKKLPQPRKQILLEIAAIYDATWKSMGGENLNEWVREIDNPENFLSYAFTFLHKMCHLQDQICFTLFEPSVGDPGLQTRLLLAQDLYLTRACHMLLRVTQCRANLPTSWCEKLNDTDVYCFLRIATPHHLEAELLCCKKMPCEAKARRAGDGHIGLIAWALDHGSNVKEYAIAFLKAECLDDAEFATEILPRLLPHTRLLATDEQVTLVLIERITALRRKLIPYNHHKNLLQALMPLLSATTKTSLLSKLHTKPDTQVTPLSVEKARFASQLRNFVNHLTAGDSSTDTDDNTPSYPWISQQPILLSVEILIEANLLLLTRPMTFLLDIIRLPVTQNSAALLPVVHQLLDHLSFSFPLCLFGKDEPLVCSLFTNGLFQRDTDWNLEQTTLLDILQRFLPLNEQLDAVQVCIAAQASRFVKTTPNKTASSTQGVAVMPPNMPSQAGSTSNQLFSWSLSSLLHLSATWPILPKLISLFASHPYLPLLLTCLRPIFIPTPSLPPSVILPTCETLLDLIPTSSLSTKQHVVLLCLCGLDYDCVRQRLQDILMQDADLLTRIFDNLPLERFPDYRFNLQLPPGSLQSGYITPSCFNERFIDCLQLKSGISRVNEFVGQVFLQPITPTSLMTLFQFVSLTENLWVYAVRAILSSAELNPKIRCLWNAMPLHIMLVTLFTYLHQIMSTSRDEEEIVLRWALTLGCVDQLILAGLLNLSYRLRPKLTSISLMQNQGTLDFFDFIFSLLKMVFWTLFHAKSSTNPLLENGFMLSIICLTMEALAQRLLVRIVLPSTNASKSHSTSSILTEQVGLLIAEVHSFKDRVKKTASGHLFDPLDHLCESLSIIEQSLQCQRHPLLTASLNCAVLESHL